MSDAGTPISFREQAQLIITRLARSRSVADILWVGSGTLAAGGLGALSAAIYARTLGVEEFGIFTLIMSLILMLSSLCDLGIGGSLVKFGAEALARGDGKKVKRAVSLAAQAKAVVIAGIIVLAAVFLKPLIALLGARLDERMETYFLYSLLTMGAIAAGAFFPPVYQIFRLFRRQAIVATTGPFIKVIVLVVLVLASVRLTVGGALWVEGSVAFAFAAIYWFWSPVRSIDLHAQDPELRRSMLSFNKWLSLYFIISTVGGRIDITMLGAMAGGHDLGLYGASLKIVGVVVVGANAYLSVLLPDYAGLLSLEALRRKRRTSLLLSAAFTAGLVIIACIADPLVRVVFGVSYAGVAPLLRVMLAGAAALVLGYPLLGTLYVLNKSVVYPVMAGAAAIAVALACWLLIPRIGAMGAAIGFAGGNAASSAVAAVYYLIRGRQVEERHDWNAPEPGY